MKSPNHRAVQAAPAKGTWARVGWPLLLGVSGCGDGLDVPGRNVNQRDGQRCEEPS